MSRQRRLWERNATRGQKKITASPGHPGRGGYNTSGRRKSEGGGEWGIRKLGVEEEVKRKKKGERAVVYSVV